MIATLLYCTHFTSVAYCSKMPIQMEIQESVNVEVRTLQLISEEPPAGIIAKADGHTWEFLQTT